MIINLMLASLLSLTLPFSLRYCLKAFDKLELTGLLIWSSCVNQQIFFFISTAYKFVDLVDKYIPYIIIRLNYGLITPSLLVWGFYLIRRTSRFWLKILIILLWTAVAISLERYEIAIGVLIDNNWTLSHEIFKRLAIAAIVYIFMIGWQNVLKRDKVII